MSSTPETFTEPVASIIASGDKQAGATILLVEDDRSLRRYLEVTLRRAGFNVIAAADGLEAMKAALTSEIDAVVTDAIMPHLNGYELCRFLRRHPKLMKLPIVLLSGSDRSGTPQEKGADADAYLAKPIRPEELTGCIETLLALSPVASR